LAKRKNLIGKMKKRKRSTKSDDDDNDDDFVMSPQNQTTKKQKQEPYHPFNGGKISTRFALSNLITLFETFNEEQKKIVDDMGFGKVLNLKVDSIPTSLGYWMVDNYNQHTHTLNTGINLIQITPQLVNEVMGIPIGSIPIKNKRAKKKDAVVAEWRSQFKKTTWISRPFTMAYLDHIRGLKHSGRYFMLNFLVAFFSIVGETNDNSFVNQSFLNSVRSNINIKDLRWCDYMIYCLNNAKASWNQNGRFKGPLLLLAV